SSMWVKKGTCVSTLRTPVPSSPRVTRICDSEVLRSTVTRRITGVYIPSVSFERRYKAIEPAIERPREGPHPAVGAGCKLRDDMLAHFLDGAAPAQRVPHA